MAKLKEKDIVKKIVGSWENYFPDLSFVKTEFSFRDFRVDIFADFEVDREAFGLKPSEYKLRAPVFFEVKYSSEMRDLIYELQKQIRFRDFYTNIAGNLAIICVILDKFEDQTMIDFMIENQIYMYQINIEDDNIDTLTLTEVNKNFSIELMEEIA